MMGLEFTVIGFVVAPVVNVRVKAPTVPVIVNPLNVATPVVVLTVAVLFVNDPVPDEIDAVTKPVFFVIVPFAELFRVTIGWVVSATPFVAVVE